MTSLRELGQLVLIFRYCLSPCLPRHNGQWAVDLARRLSEPQILGSRPAFHLCLHDINHVGLAAVLNPCIPLSDSNLGQNSEDAWEVFSPNRDILSEAQGNSYCI